MKARRPTRKATTNEHEHQRDRRRRTRGEGLYQNAIFPFRKFRTTVLSSPAFILHPSSFVLRPSSFGYPPAPHHLIYGQVRDEQGHPLQVENGQILLQTITGVVLAESIVPGLGEGINYRVEVPLDSGMTAEPYAPTALSPAVSFRLRVKIGSQTYLPLEMTGDYSRLGDPAKQTRIDLTLGEDADGDGIPDAWERALIANLGGGKTLADIRPGDDSDGDGLTNLQEYLAGTYAYDPENGFALKLVRLNGGAPVLEFLAISGRNYTVYGSENLRVWNPVSFKPMSTEDSPSASYQATDTRQLQVEVTVPADGAPPKFFKLMVR